jgi:hypothetical protein
MDGRYYIWPNWYMVLKQGSGGTERVTKRRFGRWLPELGSGGAPAHDFQQGGALDEEEVEGNSPRSLWVLREWQLRLVAVGGSSVRRQPIVALPGDSLAEVRGKTESL